MSEQQTVKFAPLGRKYTVSKLNYYLNHRFYKEHWGMLTKPVDNEETVNIPTIENPLTKISKLQIAILETVEGNEKDYTGMVPRERVYSAMRSKFPNLSPAALSRSLKRLELRDLIRRTGPSWSHKQNYVKLTVAGRACLKARIASAGSQAPPGGVTPLVKEASLPGSNPPLRLELEGRGRSSGLLPQG
jgi:hypothetical protein